MNGRVDRERVKRPESMTTGLQPVPLSLRYNDPCFLEISSRVVPGNFEIPTSTV